jgi:hypothetical protein
MWLPLRVFILIQLHATGEMDVHVLRMAFASMLCALYGYANVAWAATPAVWQPPAGYKQIPIWPKGVPDMAGTSDGGEYVETTKAPDVVAGRPYVGVYDVTSPTITVFPAKEKNTGAAIIVFPGGGFQMLAIDLEGTEVCDWMT